MLELLDLVGKIKGEPFVEEPAEKPSGIQQPRRDEHDPPAPVHLQRTHIAPPTVEGEKRHTITHSQERIGARARQALLSLDTEGTKQPADERRGAPEQAAANTQVVGPGVKTNQRERVYPFGKAKCSTKNLHITSAKATTVAVVYCNHKTPHAKVSLTTAI